MSAPPHPADHDGGPLHYALRELHGVQVLACDDAADGRIVEALGDVGAADHIAVVVPGNDNNLSNYFDAARATLPRRSGLALLHTMQALRPQERSAVVVWVGYRTPNGFIEAASNEPARSGLDDLARLTHYLPQSAHITLVGHSYGAAVCGLALSRSRAADCVALGSPGIGVRHRGELGYGGRLWAALGPSDWIRFFPSALHGSYGLGAPPLSRRIGAARFETGNITGHCGYYTEGSESLRNIARIALGRFGEVTARPGSEPVRVPAQHQVQQPARPQAEHARMR